MSEELKPCPWCQWSEDLTLIDEHDVAAWARYAVWCSNCAVTGPRAESEQEARRLWNTRATEASDE